jgi:hypothetical protein
MIGPSTPSNRGAVCGGDGTRMSSRACRTRPPHRSWPSPLSPRWTRSLLPTSNPSSAETSAPHPRREMRERRHVSGSWATAPFRQKLTRTATGLGPPRRPSSAIRDWSTRSARTVHKNARPGEPEGLPDLTFRTLTRPALSCQAAAERRSPVGSSRRGSVSRFRQIATCGTPCFCLYEWDGWTSPAAGGSGLSPIPVAPSAAAPRKSLCPATQG